MKNKRTCDYIAEAIQNEILSGRMEAGQPLRQEELSEKLGYSRMPIREALQILEEQGLVRRLATRHVVVADFSERNIEEIFDMVGNVEKKALEDLVAMSFDWEFSAEGEDAEEKFHEFVYGTITNGLFRRLLETWQTVISVLHRKRQKWEKIRSRSSSDGINLKLFTVHIAEKIPS